MIVFQCYYTVGWFICGQCTHCTATADGCALFKLPFTSLHQL